MQDRKESKAERKQDRKAPAPKPSKPPSRRKKAPPKGRLSAAAERGLERLFEIAEKKKLPYFPFGPPAGVQ